MAARYCACGCGERIPDHYAETWQYIRGHKSAPVTGKNKRAKRAKVTEPDTTDYDTLESEDYNDADDAAYTLEDAAADTPDDPEPPDNNYDGADSKPTPYVRITKKVRNDIEGKVGMMLGMVAMGISMRDPVCGPAIGDNAENIAAKIVPIICKSPDMVMWFTKSGSFVLWLDLFMACLPVAKIAAGHHIGGRQPVTSGDTDALTPDFSAYRID